jgi:hypothetical protein
MTRSTFLSTFRRANVLSVSVLQALMTRFSKREVLDYVG